MSTRVEFVIDKLEGRGSTVKKAGSGWIAQCPGHDDNKPSLSISEGDKKEALLYCHAGCSSNDVVAALGMTMKDLFEPDLTKSMQVGERKEYVYRDENGEILSRVVRSGNKEFRQHAYLGDGKYAHTLGETRRVLYNLQAVRRAIQNGDPVWIVEGEKDSETLVLSGLVATTNPGGADNGTGGKFTGAMVEQLEGSTQINIIIDNDTPGEIHGRYLFKQLQRSGRNINIYRPTIGKDITEHLACGGTKETLELLDSTDNPTGWIEKQSKEPEAEFDSGWKFKDLGPILSGEIEPAVPSICKTTNNKALFYGGKVNALWGASDSGKTTVLMFAMAQEISAGRHVGYLDFEDKAERFVEMLHLDHGLSKAQILQYAHYLHPVITGTDQEIADLVASAEDLCCTLVGIDSVGEALGLDGTNQNDDGPVAKWHRDLARKISANGICVVLVDHVPKGTDDNGDEPIGSQRKKAAIDGIAYKVKAIEAFSKEKSGKIRINVAKDRPGTYAKKSTVAIAVINVEDGFSMTLYDPQDATPNRNEHARDDLFVEILSDWIWTERDKIFSGVICRDHIETLRKKSPKVTFRLLEDAVKVLRSSEYSVQEGQQFRLVNRFHAEQPSTTLHGPSTQPISPTLHASTTLHTGSTSGFTEAPQTQGDQSEQPSTLVPPPLEGTVVKGCDDTPNNFYEADPFSDEELFAETQPNSYDRRNGR